MLAIPNLNTLGDPVGVKFRTLPPADKHYDQPAGQQVRLYNLRALGACDGGVRMGTSLALTEGELDAVVLTQLGIPAVAVPGAHNWKPYHRRVFDGIERLVFFHDNDEAGRELLKTLLGSGLPVEPAQAPGYEKDLNDALLAGYGDRIKAIFYGKGRNDDAD